MFWLFIIHLDVMLSGFFFIILYIRNWWTDIFRASKNVMFPLYLISIISLSLLHMSQELENAGGFFFLQFGHLVLLGLSSTIWSESFWSYLPLVNASAYLSLRSPYF